MLALNLTVSDWDSSDAEVLMESKVECIGKPISWNEFMLEKPLSSSVWWHVENRFDFVRPFAGTPFNLLLTMLGKIVGSSSSLLEFDELDDEWTDDSSVLRNDECESRSKPNKKSPRCGWKALWSDELFACDKIGSWVWRKFWTVRDNRKASFDSFSASTPASGLGLGRLSKCKSNLSSSGCNVNFSGLTSTADKDLFFGDRRLK